MLVYVCVLIVTVGGSVVAPLPPSATATIAGAAALSSFITFAACRAPFSHSIAASTVAAMLFYGAVLRSSSAILDRLTPSGQIQSLRAAIRPEDEIVLYRSHLPSVAFYTARYPYLVGCGGELESGMHGKFGGRRLRTLEELQPIVAKGGSASTACSLIDDRCSRRSQGSFRRAASSPSIPVRRLCCSTSRKRATREPYGAYTDDGARLRLLFGR